MNKPLKKLFWAIFIFGNKWFKPSRVKELFKRLTLKIIKKRRTVFIGIRCCGWGVGVVEHVAIHPEAFGPRKLAPSYVLAEHCTLVGLLLPELELVGQFEALRHFAESANPENASTQTGLGERDRLCGEREGQKYPKRSHWSMGMFGAAAEHEGEVA